MSPDFNADNPFVNFRVPNNHGFYHAYSSKEDTSYFLVAMSEVTDSVLAGNAPSIILKYDLFDPESDPLAYEVPRAVNKIIFTDFSNE